MQRRLYTFAARIAVACALMGMTGCATLIKGTSVPVSINSTPGSANVEIKRLDGLVVQQGKTPMTVRLPKGKDYTVTISLDGYETHQVSVIKSGFETVAFLNCCFLYATIIPWGIDFFANSLFKLEPNMIHVSLQEVTAQDGGDTAIYAFLIVVDEEGRQTHTAAKMTPESDN